MRQRAALMKDEVCPARRRIIARSNASAAVAVRATSRGAEMLGMRIRGVRSRVRASLYAARVARDRTITADQILCAARRAWAKPAQADGMTARGGDVVRTRRADALRMPRRISLDSMA